MWIRLIALMLISSIGGTEVARASMAAARQVATVQSAALVQAQAPAAVGTVEVPVGTKVPLSLVTQIMSKSTKAGDTVRAVVAFPVTVGNQVAIPAGTFVEGQLVSTTATKTAKKKTRYGANPAVSSSGLQIHFTRLVYANGYTVALDAQNQASVMKHADGGVEVASLDYAYAPFGNAALPEGQFGEPLPPPQLPQLPQPSMPNGALIVGVMAGALALAIVAGALTMHHRKNEDEVLYDAGWQFSMSLTSALSLDAAQVMDAARMAPAMP